MFNIFLTIIDGLNLTTFLAVILTSTLVFGLRPILSFLFADSNFPNDEILTILSLISSEIKDSINYHIQRSKIRKNIFSTYSFLFAIQAFDFSKFKIQKEKRKKQIIVEKNYKENLEKENERLSKNKYKYHYDEMLLN